MEKVKYKMGFSFNIIVCILVHLFTEELIDWRVKRDFAYLLKYDIVQMSMKEYMMGIRVISLIAIVLCLIWWGLAYMENEVGKWYEENTTGCVLLLSAVLLVAVIFLWSINGGIKDNAGTEHVLYYSYSVWLAFLFNSFGFPPQTVKEVLLPGGSKVRSAVSIIVACVALWILIW